MRGERPLRRRGRMFRAFERWILGFGMGVVAFFIERRLIKALKKGSMEPAPRTAAEMDPDATGREGQLTTSTHEVRDQPER